jgi:hypothetical protein
MVGEYCRVQAGVHKLQKKHVVSSYIVYKRCWPDSNDIGVGAKVSSIVQVLHTEFDFRRILFELNKDTNAFQQVSFPDKGIVRDYLQSRGLSSEAEALAALEKWGPNVVEVPAPTFMEMLKEQMIAPFFVFQVGCVWVLLML